MRGALPFRALVIAVAATGVSSLSSILTASRKLLLRDPPFPRERSPFTKRGGYRSL